jgi:hypothetical protein
VTLENRRRQHCVGQGFFHTGALYADNELQVTYAYDCGAMHTYSQTRSREIQGHLQSVGRNSILDLLFISHVHADHINGLPQLLHKGTGLKVDTIILPLVDDVERLIAFARTSADDGASAQNDFYRNFTLDPIAALAQFEPRQILLVSGGEPGLMSEDGPRFPSDDERKPKIYGQSRRGGRGFNWILVDRETAGNEMVERIDGYNSSVSVISSSTALVSTHKGVDWLWAPYIDPAVRAGKREFLDALAVELGLPKSNMKKWLSQALNRKELVVGRADALATAYEAVFRQINLTSMCLYSGPALPGQVSVPISYSGQFGVTRHFPSLGRKIAWLGTGDAMLGQVQRRKSIARHYGGLWKQVTTMTLPHHGSDRNFHEDLISTSGASAFIAAADRYGNWKHPGAHTVQLVFSAPSLLQVVTSSPHTSVRERCTIG